MAKCSVCNRHDFEEDFEVCPVCNWQHDRVQENDPDFWGGANDLSLNDYKTQWLNHKEPIAV